MEPITDEEVGLIQELRANVDDVYIPGELDTDAFFLRWLRAREWHIQKAEDMLRKHMHWRKEYDIDMIKKWEPPCASIPVDFPMEISGFDKGGCPVLIVPYASWDIRKGVEAGLQKDLIRYIDQYLEYIEILLRQIATGERKRPAPQLTIVFDMNNLSFWQLTSMKTVETILEVIRRYEANHPELLHRAYVINAARIFHILFNIVKPFLSPRTLSKVSIFTSQKSQWLPTLLGDIEEDQLPLYFGGKRRTALPMYQPKKYEASTSNALNTVSINPGEKVLLAIDVVVPNSRIKWTFRTDHYDIEFSLYRDKAQVNAQVPSDRLFSQLMEIKGEVSCTVPGKYIAEFNNSYSEIRRAKTLHYNFTVIPPPSSSTPRRK